MQPVILAGLPTLAGLFERVLPYLDPGSGSFILQVLLASLLAGGLFLRTFWSRITGLFKGKGPQEPDDDDSND
ncbi:MAG: hypothetical protein ACKOC5_04350 [Chloroflexota bacterium]